MTGHVPGDVRKHAHPEVAASLAETWDEGYRKGNLDGYFGTSDEWEKNPHGTDHRAEVRQGGETE